MSKPAYYGKYLFMAYKSALAITITGTLGFVWLYSEYVDSITGIMFAYLLSGIAVSNMCLWLTNVLNPRNAVDIGGFGNLFSGMLYFVLPVFNIPALYYVFSFLPVTAINISIFTVFQGSGSYQTTNIWVNNLMIAISAVFYLWLFIRSEEGELREKKNEKKVEDIVSSANPDLKSPFISNSAIFLEQTSIIDPSVTI